MNIGSSAGAGRFWAITTALLLVLSACAAAPYIVPAGVEFARNLLLAAANNYGGSHREEISRLIIRLSQRYTKVGGAPGAPQYPIVSAPYPGQAGGTPAVQAQLPYPVQSQVPYPAPYPQTQPPYPQQPQYPQYGSPAASSYPPHPPSQQSAYPAGAPSGGHPQYPTAGGFPQAIPSQPPAVDVALVRQQATAQGPQVVLMNDGDVLRGNPANPQAGDKFKIIVRPDCDCYLYVLAIDGSGWAQGIFPTKRSRYPNPVVRHQEYVFPEGANWYALDEVPGIETFYVVVSPNQRPDLEESIARMAGKERPRARGAEQVTAAAVVPDGFARKDAGDTITVRSEGGQQAKLTPSRYVAKAPGEDVTVTRWFKHE